MLYIKGFDKDLCSEGGTQFEIGKEYKLEGGLFRLCRGLATAHEFYSCEKEKGNRFCYIECLSEVVYGKGEIEIGCSHIRIVKEIVGDELNLLLGLVNGNVGLFNMGDRNTGDRNTGDWNTGNGNSGDWNVNDRNTGDRNVGDRNTGDWNTGNGNSGDWNTGSLNSGEGNVGDRNTGDRNVGDRNTGIFNACDYSTGVFCRQSPDIKIFDCDSGMTMEEFKASKFYAALYSVPFALTKWDDDEQKGLVAIDFKEACAAWWDEMAEENRKIIKEMPNFDAEVFEDITGLKV